MVGAAGCQTCMAQCIRLQSSRKFHYSVSSVAADGVVELHTIFSYS